MEEKINEPTFVLIKKSDNNYLGFSKAPIKPVDTDDFIWHPWSGENPLGKDDVLFKWDNGLILKSQTELNLIQAAIDKEADINLKQAKVIERLADAVNNILRYIEKKNTLTVGEQKFVDDFCNDYDAWISAKE